MTFSEVGSNCGSTLKQALENSPNKFHCIGGSKDFIDNFLNGVRNWTFEVPTMWQWVYYSKYSIFL